MEVPGTAGRGNNTMPEPDVEFLKNSLLDVLVPQASDLNVADALASTRDEGRLEDTILISSIAQRSVLFFDELISIYIVLRTPYHDEPQLRSYISRLAFTLEAHAISCPSTSLIAQDANDKNSTIQEKDTIWSCAINASEDPLIAVHQGDSEGENSHVYIIWKKEAFLSRPRIRLQFPMIVFKPSARIRQPHEKRSSSAAERYLPDGIPASRNLLESLKDDPSLKSAQPRLSALRLSRISPSPRGLTIAHQPLKAIAQRAFRAMPALSARMRFSRSDTFAAKRSIIASLDVETTSLLNCNTSLESVEIHFADGSAEECTGGHTLILPMECRPRDNVAFFYRFSQAGKSVDEIAKTANSRSLTVTISAIVLVSEICHAHVEMRWRTGLEFLTASQSIHGMSGPVVQQMNRPASIPVSSIHDAKQGTPIPAPEVSGELTGRQSTIAASALGAMMTFAGPREVYVGEVFSWDVFIMNSSSKPLTLAIMALSKRRRGEARNHLSRPSSSSAGGTKETENAEAVVDEMFLYAMQRNTSTEITNLVNLSTDVRIGPLNPGFCHSAELRFLPLARGALQLEAIRVVDLVSNDFIDVRELPDIIAEERRGL